MTQTRRQPPADVAGHYNQLSGGSVRSLFSSSYGMWLAVLIGITLLLGSFGLFFYHQIEEELMANDEKQQTVINDALSIVGVMAIEQPPLAFDDINVATMLQSAMENNPHIASIEIKNSSGRSLFKVESQLRMQDNVVNKSTIKLHQHHQTEMATIGTLQLGLIETKNHSLLRTTQWAMIFMFISSWVIACLAVAAVTWILSKQMQTLVKGVQRLSSGEFGYRIPEKELWGELKHLADAFNDMSQRLRVYEDQNIDTLTFERNKLEAILLSITDGVVVMDNDGQIVIINDSASAMLNMDSSDVLLGAKITDYTTHDGERPFAPIIDAFRLSQRDPEQGVFLRTVEVENHNLRTIISSIKDTDGNILGFVMIMYDVTRETEIDRMKTQFISNVSHELRTPVTTIKSYVDTIVNHGKELDDVTYQEFLETINNETDRLKKMVNDILDFSRLESPELKLEMDYHDITPVISLTLQSVKVLADQKSHAISSAIESGLPKAYMNADSIERVIRNLLSNAIKYTPDHGRIKIRAELSQDAKFLEVSVEDNGVGVPASHLDRIWDRFYRVENKVHTVKGTGLGLHLVKIAIEEHHHGQVFVESTEGKGSRFGFRIPISPVAAPAKSAIPDNLKRHVPIELRKS